jgi:alginate O-acetyltransferase complex protein AlgI
MDLLSIPYAGFVLLTVLLFHATPSRLRPLCLCLVSLLFYGFYSPVSAAILVILTLVVFYTARALESRRGVGARRGLFFIAAFSLLLGYLVLIKVLPIFREHGRALSTTRIFLALGVSYYTFKLMGYLIDIYWAKHSAWTDPVRFLAFATFYPQLPAGPIQRAEQFDFPSSSAETSELMRYGLRRILWGAAKKSLIADQLGSMISSIAAFRDALDLRHSL